MSPSRVREITGFRHAFLSRFFGFGHLHLSSASFGTVCGGDDVSKLGLSDVKLLGLLKSCFVDAGIGGSSHAPGRENGRDGVSQRVHGAGAGAGAGIGAGDGKGDGVDLGDGDGDGRGLATGRAPGLTG